MIASSIDLTAPEGPSAARRVRSSSMVSSSSGSVKSKSLKSSLRKSSSLPTETVEYLKAWIMSPEHVAHPYPTEQEKAKIMADTGIELKQLTNWFVNNRKRFWKPRVEARLQQQAHVQAAAMVAVTGMTHVVSPAGDRPTFATLGTQKPESAPLLTLDMTQPDQTITAPPPTTTTAINTLSVMAPPSAPFSGYVSESAPRTVSEVSSSASESGSYADSQEENDNDVSDEIDESTGLITRTESVDVHVLRPISGGEPTIEDVTILSNVPVSRKLCSYHNCMMAYSFGNDITGDRKKIQNRRDAEVVRLKKHFLKSYLTQNSAPVVPTVPPSPSKRKRTITEDDEEVVWLRPKYNQKNKPCTWKRACVAAKDCHDSGLPSLEEAALLFGYAQ